VIHDRLERQSALVLAGGGDDGFLDVHGDFRVRLRSSVTNPSEGVNVGERMG
jgi:hypothetical protein